MTRGQAPLLVLDRVGKGRVAMLTSDQARLWGRGFEGGGPQLELCRIAHWSMKEPDLEEEALTADVAAGLTVTITRRTMDRPRRSGHHRRPDGQTATLAFGRDGPGRFSALDGAGPGALPADRRRNPCGGAWGPAAPRVRGTVASGTALGTAGRRRGARAALSDGIPRLRQVREGRPAHGQGVGGNWIGITPRDAASISGLTHRPLLPAWGWLVLIAGLALAGWLAEGRGATPPAHRA